MTVQHVGPKLALGILSVLKPEELGAAIVKGDVERIDAVPGVGPKVAERVVRELCDKVGDLKLASPSSTPTDDSQCAVPQGNEIPADSVDEAVSALVNLAMKPAEARRIVEAVVAEDSAAAKSSEIIVRKSLAVLRGE